MLDYDDENGGMDDWENTEQFSKYMSKITQNAEESHVVKPKAVKKNADQIKKEKENK